MIAIRAVLAVADGVARLLLVVSMALMIILISAMMYEVVARYVFSASTLWAADISYMVNGAMFVLVAAYAVLCDSHVRVDVLSARFPAGLRQTIRCVFNLVLLVVLLVILKASYGAAWKLYVSKERVLSAWEPLAWPFYAAITVGFGALVLQTVAEVLRSGLSLAGAAPAERVETQGHQS